MTGTANGVQGEEGGEDTRGATLPLGRSKAAAASMRPSDDTANCGRRYLPEPVELRRRSSAGWNREGRRIVPPGIAGQRTAAGT